MGIVGRVLRRGFHLIKYWVPLLNLWPWLAQLLGRDLSVERVTVPITGLSAALNGTRVVQLSDFHYGGGLSPAQVDAALDAVRAAEPQLLVLTGDYVDDDPAPIHGLAAQLAALTGPGAKFPVVAILGNHDVKVPGARETIIESLRSHGVTVLWNETVFPLGRDLAVVGMADKWSGAFNVQTVQNALGAASGLSPQTPRLVLSHNPDTWVELAGVRADLILSGHTHGGQIRFFGYPVLKGFAYLFEHYVPASITRSLTWLPTRVVKYWEYHGGLHNIGSNTLYTNRGLGAHYPGRLWCRPEVTIFTLTTAGNDARSR